jgi:hypothetical protein
MRTIRVTLLLDEDERNALRRLAEREFRDPRDQAALIVRQVLEARGLLPHPQSPAEEKQYEAASEPIPA